MRAFGRRRSRFGFELEALCSEIEKQPMFDLSSGEIIDELNGMRNGQGLHGFEFDNQFVPNDEIGLEYPNFFTAIEHG